MSGNTSARVTRVAVDALERLREICLALPDTKETLTWGLPHFRVGDKIFAGYGDEDGTPTVGFKLEKPHAEAIAADRRFTPSKYVGRHGWVTMDLSYVEDWGHVEDLILESFHLIAPKRTLAKLD
ncbi:MAG: MmcQ/YjbR family DNA-binding protein [Acidimicrobiaceae bacterium]|nr:MmcQ/YjbR family DNA-binding protein [Acidimicrobiaceae bacterium]MYE76704.1 MmcQ/YjbR family DNA-binding protein [Acidimicrobiaceae bacterium]